MAKRLATNTKNRTTRSHKTKKRLVVKRQRLSALAKSRPALFSKSKRKR